MVAPAPPPPATPDAESLPGEGGVGAPLRDALGLAPNALAPATLAEAAAAVSAALAVADEAARRPAVVAALGQLADLAGRAQRQWPRLPAAGRATWRRARLWGALALAGVRLPPPADAPWAAVWEAQRPPGDEPPPPLPVAAVAVPPAPSEATAALGQRLHRLSVTLPPLAAGFGHEDFSGPGGPLWVEALSLFAEAAVWSRLAQQETLAGLSDDLFRLAAEMWSGAEPRGLPPADFFAVLAKQWPPLLAAAELALAGGSGAGLAEAQRLIRRRAIAPWWPALGLATPVAAPVAPPAPRLTGTLFGARAGLTKPPQGSVLPVGGTRPTWPVAGSPAPLAQTVQALARLDPLAEASAQAQATATALRAQLAEVAALRRELRDLLRRQSLDGAGTAILVELEAALQAADGTAERLVAPLQRVHLEVADLRQVALAPLLQELGRTVEAEAASRDRPGLRWRAVAEGLRLEHALVGPLTEALRLLLEYSLAESIEPAATRSARGKGAAATLLLSASLRQGLVEITLADDGQGLDLLQLRAALATAALLPPGAHLTEAELPEWLLHPRLAPPAVAQARRLLASVRGTLSVHSLTGRGLTWTVRVPTSIGGLEAVLVEVAGSRFALPAQAVAEVVPVPDGQAEEIAFRGQPVPLARLDALLGLRPRLVREALVLTGAETPFAMAVGRALRTFPTFSRALPPLLQAHPAASALVTGPDGEALILLDPARLGELPRRGALVAPWPRPAPEAAPAPQAEPTLLWLGGRARLRRRALEVARALGWRVASSRHPAEAAHRLAALGPQLVIVEALSAREAQPLFAAWASLPMPPALLVLDAPAPGVDNPGPVVAWPAGTRLWRRPWPLPEWSALLSQLSEVPR